MASLRRGIVAALWAVLILSLLGCSVLGFGGGPTPTPTRIPRTPKPLLPPRATPTATPAPPSPGETPEGARPVRREDLLNLIAPLEAIGSYRLEARVEILPEDPQTPGLQVRLRETWASTTTYSVTLTLEIPGLTRTQLVQVAQVGPRSWFNLGEGWVAGAGTGASPPTTTLELEAMVPPSAQDLVFLGSEPLREVQTQRYRFRIPRDQAFRTGPLEEESGTREARFLEDLEGNLWLAPLAGTSRYYVARYELTGPGVFTLTTGVPLTGTYRLSLRLYDVGRPLEVRPPTDVVYRELTPPGFEPGTFPLPEDAEIRFSVQGELGLIATARSLEEVAAFYRSALAEAGWTLVSERSLGNGLSLTFQKEAHTLSLLLAPEEGTGKTTLFVSGR